MTAFPSLISIRKVGSGWWSPQQSAESWALVWACQALRLSVLRFCRHLNPGQPQVGEGPQQTPLEVTTKEGSKMRKPGAHEAGTVQKGTRTGLTEPSGVLLFARQKGSADS